jgi:hypothetical protein
MYHNPKERCTFNPCLLGHDAAKGALKASKAFGRFDRLAKQQENLLLEDILKQQKETAARAVNAVPKLDDQHNTNAPPNPQTD